MFLANQHTDAQAGSVTNTVRLEGIRMEDEPDEPKIWEKSLEEGARHFADYLDKIGKGESLPSKVRVYLSADNSEAELDVVTDRLHDSFEELAKWFIDPLKEGKPARAEYGYEKLWILMSAAYVIGQQRAVTPAAKKFFDHTGTRKPRESRKKAGQTKKSLAIQAYLEGKITEAHFQSPYGAASGWLDEINVHLGKLGLGSSSTASIGREIERMATKYSSLPDVKLGCET